MTLLTDQYAGQIADVVSCYDRIVMMGTLPVTEETTWGRTSNTRHNSRTMP
jgi:hypothetical protein